MVHTLAGTFRRLALPSLAFDRNVFASFKERS